MLTYGNGVYYIETDNLNICLWVIHLTKGMWAMVLGHKLTR